MKYPIRLLVCSLILFGATCGFASKKPPQPATSPTAITPDAAAFLNNALDIMQQHSLHAQSVDWAELRTGAFKRAAGAFNPIDTYPALYWALVQLNDPSSRLRLPPGLYPDQIALLKQAEQEAAESAPRVAQSAPTPSPFASRGLPDGHIVTLDGRNFGYISLPRCSAKDNDGLLLYASDVRRILTELSAQGPKGWIVDLRGNGGGNMWPMLTGIGPVLGEGVVGYFVTADGNIPWFYQDGKTGTRTATGLEAVSLSLSDSPLRVTPMAPVAVLMDDGTASSAEAIAVAFHARPDTRFFGQHTAGKSTAAQGFHLDDGAELYLTTAIDADRTGKQFPDGLAPDQPYPAISALPPAGSDAALLGAQTWLAANTAPPPPPAAPIVPVVRHKARQRPRPKKVIVHQGS